MRSLFSFGFGTCSARLRRAGLTVALLLTALLAANAAVAHDRSHPAPAAAKAALGDITGDAAGSLAATAPTHPDDPGCAHGPLHVFCAVGPSCCMEAADQAVYPMAHSIRMTGSWRHAPVAGLAPPPLDRPPR